MTRALELARDTVAAIGVLSKGDIVVLWWWCERGAVGTASAEEAKQETRRAHIGANSDSPVIQSRLIVWKADVHPRVLTTVGMNGNLGRSLTVRLSALSARRFTGERLWALTAAVVIAVGSAVSVVLGGLGSPVLMVRSVSGAVFVAAGGVLWARSGSGRMGTLFVLAGCAMCLTNLVLWPGPVATTLRVLLAGYPLFGALLVHLVLAYPTGHLGARLDRFVLGFAYLVTVAYMLGQYLIGDNTGLRYCAPLTCSNLPPALIGSDAAEGVFAAWALVAYPAVLVLVVAVVTRRWWTATAAGRRMLRPVMLNIFAGCGLGLSTTIIRGFRLNEHEGARDVIAVVWGAGVAVLAVSLLLGVVRSRLVLYGMGELITNFEATHPTAMDLGMRGTTQRLQELLTRLLGDPSVQVLHLGGDGAGFLDSAELAVPQRTPNRSWLPVGSPPVGAVVHDSSIAIDARVAEAVTAAVSMVLRNLHLQQQLAGQLVQAQASRARLAAAADAERRRLERDLHDGAQQYLVSSAVVVHLARQRLHTAPDEADQLLGTAEDQLQLALHEIRDLARGLHPAILSDSGVGAAIESLAQRLPIEVTVCDQLTSRHPIDVETAAYFVVCEALVNVAKHAKTRAGAVTLRQSSAAMHIEVVDAGRGGADPDRGSGLRGLADRLAAVGGTLSVVTGSGSGTTIQAEIPSLRLLTDHAPSSTSGH